MAERKFKVLVPLVEHQVGDTISESELAEDAALLEGVVEYMLASQVVKPVKTATRKGGSSNGSG